MRTYLAVIDETPEARVALRFAARRAAKTGGAVLVLALVPQAEFMAWESVQAAMEEEERLRVEAMVTEAAGTLLAETGLKPSILISQEEPIAAVRALLREEPEVAALVLGAAPGGSGPGPLVDHFAGSAAGLPCPVMIIPGGLTDEALDRLS
jgi:nucleotide-binding universal stress UspA family protein